MDKNMNRTNKMLSFFYAIISKEDTELEQFLIRYVQKNNGLTGVEQPLEVLVEEGDIYSNARPLPADTIHAYLYLTL